MILENKLGITNSVDLAKAEERISKARALDLFEKGLLDTFEIGTFRGLSQIHYVVIPLSQPEKVPMYGTLRQIQLSHDTEKRGKGSWQR